MQKKNMNYILLNTAKDLTNENGRIEIVSPEKTDFFNDICSSYTASNAPFYHTTAEQDFIFRCKIKPDFQEVYDAGGILVHESNNLWIKFAFEKTDLGYPSVVSVVTKNTSDDSNGVIINENCIWLQVVRKENNWCLHYSHDNKNWKMVRYFRFEMDTEIKIGIFSQSPCGKGCKVIFDELELLNYTYNNIRKGE